MASEKNIKKGVTEKKSKIPDTDVKKKTHAIKTPNKKTSKSGVKKSSLDAEEFSDAETSSSSNDELDELKPVAKGFEKKDKSSKAGSPEDLEAILMQTRLSPSAKQAFRSAAKVDYSTPEKTKEFADTKTKKSRDLTSEFNHNFTAALALTPLFYPDEEEYIEKLDADIQKKKQEYGEKSPKYKGAIRLKESYLKQKKILNDTKYEEKKFTTAFKKLEKIHENEAISQLQEIFSNLGSANLENKNIKKLLKVIEKNAIEHSIRRVEFFFYISIVYYSSNLYPDLASTSYQHGKAKNFKLHAAACHSSFFQVPRDQTVHYANRSKYTVKKPRSSESVEVESILHGLHLLDSFNATIALPGFINHLDSKLEGNLTDKSDVRKKALQIIREISIGKDDQGKAMNPIRGVTKFIELMESTIEKIENGEITYLNEDSDKAPKYIRVKAVEFLRKGIEELALKKDKYVQTFLRFSNTEKRDWLEKSSREEQEAMYLEKIKQLRLEIFNADSTFTRSNDTLEWTIAEIQAKNSAPHLKDEIETALQEYKRLLPDKKAELSQYQEKYAELEEYNNFSASQKNGINFIKKGSPLLNKVNNDIAKSLEKELNAILKNSDEDFEESDMDDAKKKLKEYKDKYWKDGTPPILISPNRFISQMSELINNLKQIIQKNTFLQKHK